MFRHPVRDTTRIVATVLLIILFAATKGTLMFTDEFPVGSPSMDSVGGSSQLSADFFVGFAFFQKFAQPVE